MSGLDTGRDIQKLDYVDALRGIAGMAVVAVHATLLLHDHDPPLPLLRLIELGTFGPHLFYLVSAFTLMRSFHERGERGQGGTVAFFLRRFFRVAPLYYLAILAYGLLGVDGTQWANQAVVSRPAISAVIANLFFVHSFSPAWINGAVPGGWAVGIEFVFYLLVPLLARTLTSLDRALYFFGACLIVQAGFDHWIAVQMTAANANLLGQFLICALPHNLPVFAMGFILYQVLQSGRVVVSGGLLFVIAIVAASVLAGHAFPANVEVSAGFLALAAVLANPSALGRLRPIFVNRITRWLGRISFPIYLTNFLFIRLLMGERFESWTPYPSANYLLAACIASMFIIGISYALHVTVEAPMMRLGKRVIAKTAAVPPVLLPSDT